MERNPSSPSLDSSSQRNKKTPGPDISTKVSSSKKSRISEGKSPGGNVDVDGDCDMTIAEDSEDTAAALPVDKENTSSLQKTLNKTDVQEVEYFDQQSHEDHYKAYNTVEQKGRSSYLARLSENNIYNKCKQPDRKPLGEASFSMLYEGMRLTERTKIVNQMQLCVQILPIEGIVCKATIQTDEVVSVSRLLTISDADSKRGIVGYKN